MQTVEAIKQRRAVKRYDADYQIPQQQVDELLALTRLAPTAFNQQNYRFVLVQDKALREQIRAAAWDQPQVTDAGQVRRKTSRIIWRPPLITITVDVIRCNVTKPCVPPVLPHRLLCWLPSPWVMTPAPWMVSISML